jgi:hypothetical protein
MSKSMPLPQTLQEAVLYASDKERVHDFMVSMRWADGIKCVHCGCDRVGFISTGQEEFAHKKAQNDTNVVEFEDPAKTKILRQVLGAFRQGGIPEGQPGLRITTPGLKRKRLAKICRPIRRL